MKISDEVYVHGYVDEIRNGTIIIRNEGGYFGTAPDEVMPSAQPEIIRCKDCKHYDGRPCGIVDWYNTADDFCSKGEGRTEG